MRDDQPLSGGNGVPQAPNTPSPQAAKNFATALYFWVSAMLTPLCPKYSLGSGGIL